MRKTLLTVMCLVAMMAAGVGLKAQEITITLDPGWNWISYPNAVAMEVDEALAMFAPMEGDVVKGAYGFSVYHQGRWVGGLTHFMPGCGYMYYSTRSEVTSFVFAQPFSSVVATATSTDITAVSAVVGGVVMLPEGSHVYLRGVCWGTEPNPDIDGSHTYDGTGIGMFTSTIEGLASGTTYYVRAYVVFDYGLAYGDVMSFTTLSGMPIPEVNTTEVTDITATSATCGGTVAADESLAIIARGVCWSTSTNPTISDSHSNDGTGTGSFVSTLTGLTSNTTYYVRAYATTAQATTYGEELSFTTSDGVVVTTLEPMLITAISAMCGGEVTVSDGTYILVKGLCWAAHENPTTNDDFYEEAESGVGSFSLSMTGLNISTTYYVRAYAVTGNGTVYGDQKTFTTRDGIPTLTTAEVSNIGSGWATGGGNIIDNGGLNVTVRGLCWSTSQNPTITDSHSTNGNGMGSFSNYITGLSAGTIYYVRAYATTTAGTGYGEQRTFTTLEDAYVDLGLPSGVLWATYNVGAEYPEAYGNHFAWGETQPKDTYNWNNYQYCNGSYNTLTKYCNNSSYGFNGFTDNLTTLLPEDDAASINWGAEWRMATKQEWQELIDNTTCIWTTQHGVSGRLFTAANGNSLFIPASGCRYDSSLYAAGNEGNYWSSSLSSIDVFGAWHFSFSLNNFSIYGSVPGCERAGGYSVRPVRCKNSVINVTVNPTEGGTLSGGGTYMDHTICTVYATANENYIFTYWTEDGEVVSTEATYSFIVCGNRNLVANFVHIGHGYVDLGLPSGLLWATCNVGAEAPEDYGDYFAWGETQPKDTYNWSTYQYCNGSYNTLTKYCNDSDYGYNGFTDNLTTLLPEDDAATANWGSGWRMPTQAEFQELLDHTTVTWTTQNGVYGRLFTASNGNSLFLPAAGYRGSSSLFLAGSYGDYWSSSLNSDLPIGAWYFTFGSDGYSMSSGYRNFGFPVRPVCSLRQN